MQNHRRPANCCRAHSRRSASCSREQRGMAVVGFRTLALTHMARSPPKRLPSGHETMLQVEPEPETRKLAAFMLTKQGYQVIEARNAAEAWRILDESAAPVDMLLTGARMIRVSGHELSQTLTRSCR